MPAPKFNTAAILSSDHSQKFMKFFSKSVLWFIFIALIIFASILSPRFLTQTNIFNVLRQISIMGTVAVGMTFVIISDGVDLSVGGVLALSCVLVPIFAPMVGGNMLLVIILCLLVGAAVGTVTGVLIAYGKMQPFMATFGMATVAEGIGFQLSGGQPILIGDARWVGFGAGSTFGFPNMAIVFLSVIVIGQFVISKTSFGINTYAIGNNLVATEMCGVRTKWVKAGCYIISATLAAAGGLLMVTRIGIGDPGVGDGYALDVIAAVIVGGTRMGGGFGSVVNTLLGAGIIGVLNNVFNLLGVPPYPQMIFKGVVIIFAVLMGQVRKR